MTTGLPRALADGEPSQCSNGETCRRDHVAEVAFATNHCDFPTDPDAVLGLNGYGVVAVRDDQRVVVWDPETTRVLSVERDLPGFLAMSGDVVRVMRDDNPDPAGMAQMMSAVERAVMVARLRVWADILEQARFPEIGPQSAEQPPDGTPPPPRG